MHGGGAFDLPIYFKADAQFIVPALEDLIRQPYTKESVMENTEIQAVQTIATSEVFTTPEVTDLGTVSEVTLGSGGFNNPDHTMYYQG
ncbi:lasso RiPP family leader peptide-containing protein [Streptomyces sp. ISL-43]|uniref:lasso RiPP family leader peptide-containing protein n=1 Tax=Streptomyces sp. ISL-43 TaxID=2819183 RepID=UPI001BE90FF5|nr:lasso RiPP family leader peptide-containing protein [Streptomyces sp. ISL-43]MBT2446048.1 lasso RiPP family leader peptide-containing protein [Streptomyces sp. ISL-43]